jgi:hypothetical protein
VHWIWLNKYRVSFLPDAINDAYKFLPFDDAMALCGDDVRSDQIVATSRGCDVYGKTRLTKDIFCRLLSTDGENSKMSTDQVSVFLEAICKEKNKDNGAVKYRWVHSTLVEAGLIDLPRLESTLEDWGLDLNMETDSFQLMMPVFIFASAHWYPIFCSAKFENDTWVSELICSNSLGNPKAHSVNMLLLKAWLEKTSKRDWTLRYEHRSEPQTDVTACGFYMLRNFMGWLEPELWGGALTLQSSEFGLKQFKNFMMRVIASQGMQL